MRCGPGLLFSGKPIDSGKRDECEDWVIVNYLADVASDSAPPGIFLRVYILGGLCFVVLCAWFVLRGYVKSGDKDDKK